MADQEPPLEVSVKLAREKSTEKAEEDAGRVKRGDDNSRATEYFSRHGCVLNFLRTHLSEG